MEILNRTTAVAMATLLLSPTIMAENIKFTNDINYGRQIDSVSSGIPISVKINNGHWIDLGSVEFDNFSKNIELSKDDKVSVKVQGEGETYETKPFSVSDNINLISIEGKGGIENLTLGNKDVRFFDTKGRGRWGITCYGLTVGLGGFVCDIKGSKYQLNAFSSGVMPVVGAGTASIDMDWIEGNVGKNVEGQSIGALFYSKVTANGDGKQVFNGDIGGIAVGVNKFTGTFDIK